MSKNCDNLITVEHYNEFSLFLGYEEVKHKTREYLDWVLLKHLDFDLKEIYMYCEVNCIENAYIANYIKTRKPIEDEENTNEREEISQFPPIVFHDETGDKEELPIQPISSIRTSEKLIKPTHNVVKKKKRRKM